MSLKYAVLAASIVAFAGAAHATTYNDVTDFSTSSSTGIWSYGSGVTGTSFTPYTNSSACLGGGTFCWQTATPVDLVPTVAANLSGGTINTGSVVFPTDVLLVHPGPSTDSIVRFTAPTTGAYSVKGFFELLDTNPSGVFAEIFAGSTSEGYALLTAPGASHPSTPGQYVPFSGLVYLTAGEALDFGVNNDGSYYNDSTGLSATIANVPEPATWALMLVGFGGMGAAIRARRKVAATA